MVGWDQRPLERQLREQRLAQTPTAAARHVEEGRLRASSLRRAFAAAPDLPPRRSDALPSCFALPSHWLETRAYQRFDDIRQVPVVEAAFQVPHRYLAHEIGEACERGRGI